MKPRLVDVHTHAQFAEFENDRDAVIRRALGAGVWMINVGTDQHVSEAAVDLAHRYKSGVFATVGLHPTDINDEFDYDFYRKLAENFKIVAIGECGLDYFRLTPKTKEKQKEIFIKHILLAREVKKPLMIHCREAFVDLIAILKENFGGRSISPGICHFFSGTIEDAQKLMDLGFSFSFGGVITFAREYEKLIKFIPLDHILLETDAPYVAPIPHRGKRNEPSYIEEVAKKISKILGKDFDEIAEITTKNAIKIFGLS
ncbi:MAG: Hydrolase, TatD family [Candidatus Giovannonibacteria bacterium GW2011_GWA1_44_29]|uniref:Hydrolase, TatD family n=1 Tax=Candidatus Giovannonibacteria bacterium GW2011_GWA1_44_29 TaxID=1618646 RepID=A0A0G1L685_9BACT|nr:MAG: Hydrolase, TatD family [Candidatus Giovannonibacteria bacterium GW2011_GWA1_44_29]